MFRYLKRTLELLSIRMKPINLFKIRFCQDVVSQAQGKVSKWKEQALSLTSIIPTDDAVLQETLGNLDSLSHLLTFMAKLQSPTLRHKHWKAILKGQRHSHIVTHTYDLRISKLIEMLSIWQAWASCMFQRSR